MSCSYAKRTDEYHGWECSVTEGACAFLNPNSKLCAEYFGEGPDAENEKTNFDFSEKKFRCYIEKCFKDAFKTENRKYDPKSWDFEWIMIRNNITGVYQLYPFMYCKFVRVLRKVEYRLKNNLMKNFNVHYGDSEQMRCLIYYSGQIDCNFTEIMIEKNGIKVSISVFDNDVKNRPNGECIPAYRKEKLVFHYWNISKDVYNSLPDDERKHLPDLFNHDWEQFKALYERTFGESVGEKYDIICSSGIKRL